MGSGLGVGDRDRVRVRVRVRVGRGDACVRPVATVQSARYCASHPSSTNATPGRRATRANGSAAAVVPW